MSGSDEYCSKWVERLRHLRRIKTQVNEKNFGQTPSFDPTAGDSISTSSGGSMATGSGGMRQRSMTTNARSSGPATGGSSSSTAAGSIGPYGMDGYDTLPDDFCHYS